MLALVGNVRWQGMLRGQLQALLHLTLGYMQMTAAQVGRSNLGGMWGARGAWREASSQPERGCQAL